MSDLLDQLAAYGRSHEERQSAAAYLAATEPDIHVIELRPEDPGGSSMRSRLGVVMGAVAAAAVVVLVVMLAGGGDDDEGKEDQVADVPEEIAVVGEFLEASNAVDLDTVASLVADDFAEEFVPYATLVAEGTAAAAGQSRFDGPCEVTNAADGATIAACPAVTTDDFIGPGIGGYVSTWTFTISDDQITGLDIRLVNAEQLKVGVYWRDFWVFLQRDHPDVFEAVEPETFQQAPGGTGDAEQMRVALEYLDEFLEQSD
ncbi:MAG: hypothetical protein AAF480_19895, partial [Actinomycetota bacterium]